jgi:hypothetical protein
VLDPACGSGAFLLGALHHLAGALGAVSERPDGAVRREIVSRSLHGVDLLDDAALLCSLRLWLALSEGEDQVRPLPNLDRRIRQGDALVDPLDLPHADGVDGPCTAAPWPTLTSVGRYRAIGPAARRYLESAPGERSAARAALATAERALARQWVDRLARRQREWARRLGAEAADRDLFGDVPAAARRARAALERVEHRRREMDQIARHLDEQGALPFFSFGVHFADAGRRVRPHSLQPALGTRPPLARPAAAARQASLPRLQQPGVASRHGAGRDHRRGGAQIDLSLLFLERACRLLAPGGVLAMLIPAKAMRALYGGGARRMLLEELEFAAIEDHALDQRSIFRADAFAAVLIARKQARHRQGRIEPPSAGCGSGWSDGASSRSSSGHEPQTSRSSRMTRRRRGSWHPPDVVAVFRRMQAPALRWADTAGYVCDARVMTGANDILVMSQRRAEAGRPGPGRGERDTVRPAEGRRPGPPAGTGRMWRRRGYGRWSAAADIDASVRRRRPRGLVPRRPGPGPAACRPA